MNAKFKVWVQVEKCEEDLDQFENVSEPECFGEFETEDQAFEFMYSLVVDPEKLAPPLEEAKEKEAPTEADAPEAS